jgi:hypothetical protein
MTSVAQHDLPGSTAQTGRSVLDQEETTGVRRVGRPEARSGNERATPALGAVLAGLATATGAEALLALVGGALGLTAWNLGLRAFPTTFSVGAGIYLLAAVNTAMFAAGYVSARSRLPARLDDRVVSAALTWSAAVAAAGLVVWASVLGLGLPELTQLANSYVRSPVGVAWYAVALSVASLISVGAGVALAALGQHAGTDGKEGS